MVAFRTCLVLLTEFGGKSKPRKIKSSFLIFISTWARKLHSDNRPDRWRFRKCEVLFMKRNLLIFFLFGIYLILTACAAPVIKMPKASPNIVKQHKTTIVHG